MQVEFPRTISDRLDSAWKEWYITSRAAIPHYAVDRQWLLIENLRRCVDIPAKTTIHGRSSCQSSSAVSSGWEMGTTSRLVDFLHKEVRMNKKRVVVFVDIPYIQQ